MTACKKKEAQEKGYKPSYSTSNNRSGMATTNTYKSTAITTDTTTTTTNNDVNSTTTAPVLTDVPEDLLEVGLVRVQLAQHVPHGRGFGRTEPSASVLTHTIQMTV